MSPSFQNDSLGVRRAYKIKKTTAPAAVLKIKKTIFMAFFLEHMEDILY
jgi:hypothetical protein